MADLGLESQKTPQGKPERSAAIDVLRGLVMVFMTLDHTRDFFSAADFSPTDLNKTDLFWFLTRWITHFCAPVFVLLAGVSAYLTSERKKGPKAWSMFLVTRGLWLMLLEITWVRLSWVGNLNYQMTFLQVIWAIGVSMVVLGIAILLFSKLSFKNPSVKPVLFGLLGLVIVGGHNSLDLLKSQSLHPALAPVWMMLHEVSTFEIREGYKVMVFYPVLAWIGVLFVGFYLGSFWQKAHPLRPKVMMVLGAFLSVLFVFLRGINAYGDPLPWEFFPYWDKTLMSFLNTTKYPPSLEYLLMTLGPALVVLGLLDHIKVSTGFFLATLGRVPLFFYLAHLPLIHLASKLLLVWSMGPQGLKKGVTLQDYGLGLGGVYLVTLVLLAILWPLCAWYSQLKARHPKSLLRYI